MPTLCFPQILCLSLIWVLNPAWSKDWTSSGGDGVACFLSKETAKKVEASIQKDRSFPNEYLPQIQSIVSLESFESEIEGEFSRAEKAPSFEALLEEKRKLIKIMSPLFDFQLRLLDAELNPKHWISQNEISEIEDSVDRKSVTAKNSKCVLVQIFDRQSLSRENMKPQIRMLYHAALWEKLLPVDQVLLYFHEALYTIGREIGAYADRSHSNSVDIRKVARVFVSDELLEHWEGLEDLKRDAASSFDSTYNLDLAARALKTLSLRQLLNRIYGDFTLLFFDDVKKTLPEEFSLDVPSQASRYKAFFDFIQETRRFQDHCKGNSKLHKGIPKSAPHRDQMIRKNCLDMSMNIERITRYFASLEQKRGDEMAFIYSVYWGYDIVQHIYPAEEIFVWEPGQNPMPRSADLDNLKYACRRLSLDEFTDSLKTIQKRAQRYCARMFKN